jgi:hypothetical protein
MKLMILSLLFYIFDALSCEVQKLDSLNLALMTEQKSVVPYQADRPLPNIPYYRIFNCSQTSMAGQFVMIALGPEVIEFDDTVRGVNFNRDFGNKKCELKGTPYKDEASYENRYNKFKNDWKLISSCLKLVIEDEGPQPLSFPAVQPGCTFLRESPNRAHFNGGYCFIKPNFGSSYLLKLKVREECLNIEHLSKLEIKTSDLFAAINVYVAGDASGKSSQLRALSNLRTRFSINPIKDLVPSSDDFGLLYPTWPENWGMPDVHLAPIKLKSPGNGNIQIQSPFLVNNNCPQKCRKNFCQSSCDYAQPIVGEFSLLEKDGIKEEVLTSWFNGGIATPGFVGTITGLDYEVPESYFIPGKEYVFEVILNEPQFDFDRFKNRIKKRLNTIEQQLGRITNSNIPRIQDIPTINDSRELPSIGTIPNIIFDQSLNGVENAVESLRAYLNFKLWPPYYSNICLSSICHPVSANILTLRATIKILTPLEGNPELLYDVVKIERFSKIVPSYVRQDFHKTKLSCHYDTQEKL